ncbi:hypothetical protein FB451DRAFT_1165144 [Mycena latifolia]|nr:hypothetical protein FB451DRAFT_1165144 [Mycena latifolia]
MSSTSFSNTSLPFISSVLPSTTASNVFVATVIVGLITVYIVHYSPARLTGVLLASLYDAEKLYHDAIEAGVFSGSDTSNEQIGATLLRLQREVSQTQTHETTLRNSLSTWKMVRDMLKGRSFTVYRCINEVKRFKTQVESPGLGGILEHGISHLLHNTW